MGDDQNDLTFDTWVTPISGGPGQSFMSQTGIWSHPFWSPSKLNSAQEQGTSEIAFLRATNALESQQSSYTLWRIDRDGSNARQLYPPAGENSRFPRDRDFMAWGPTGQDMVFIYDDQLYLYDLVDEEVRRLTHSDLEVTNPTWAPYGSGRFLALPGVDEPSIAPPSSEPIHGNIPAE
jgi:Tol biopolymer transport system component